MKKIMKKVSAWVGVSMSFNELLQIMDAIDFYIDDDNCHTYYYSQKVKVKLNGKDVDINDLEISFEDK